MCQSTGSAETGQNESHWENYISTSFHTEWDLIVETVFLSILNQMEIHFVQKIEKKTVTTIIYHSMWKEMEY